MATRGKNRRSRALAVAVMSGLVLPVTAAPPAAGAADGEIFYLRSTDGGATFGEYTNLSGDADVSASPRVAADSGGVHVVWRHGDKDGEVFYRRSPDGGVGFTEPVNLTRTPDDSSEGALAVHGPGVHMVWAEAFLDRDGNPDPSVDADEVYGHSSVDGGETFGERVNISDTRDQHTRDPDVVATATFVGVVFEDAQSADDDDIFFRRSTDGGQSWSSSRNLTGDPLQQAEAALAVSGDELHAVWEDRRDDADETDDRIGYARSADGGETWSDGVRLPSDVPTGKPWVAAAGDLVHVVSCVPADDSGLFDSDVLYHRSTDRGATWPAPVYLSRNAGDCSDPRIETAGDAVYVAWSDSSTGRTDVLFRRSGDGGASFHDTQNLSRTRGNSEDISIAVDATNGFVYMVWRDFSVDTPPAVQAPGSEPRGAAPAATGRPAEYRYFKER